RPGSSSTANSAGSPSASDRWMRSSTRLLRVWFGIRRKRSQHLERAQSLETLEMEAEERLDDALDLRGPLDLEIPAGIGDRAREQQRESRQRIRRQRDRAGRARRAAVAQQAAEGRREQPAW